MFTVAFGLLNSYDSNVASRNNLFMGARLAVGLSVVVWAACGRADAGVKAVREHRLHVSRDSRIVSEFAVTPNQDLLTLVADESGSWRLSRVRGWLEQTPQEETINIPGLKLGSRADWSGPWSAQLVITPDGKFVVCIASGLRAPPDLRADDYVSVVELSEFRLVKSIHAATAEEFSGAFRTYHLDRGGELAVRAATPLPRHPKDDSSAGGEQVKLSLLSIPGLARLGSCQYSEWSRNGAVVRREQEQSCAGLLADTSRAGTLQELFDGFAAPNGETRTNRKPRPPECSAVTYAAYLSSSGKFQREDCQSVRRGFWGGFAITKSVENVYSAPAGRKIGAIKYPEAGARFRFTSIAGKQYLLVLRGGARLTVYEVTD